MKRLVSIGGGIGSTLLLTLWVASHYPRQEIDFVMARLPNEDADVWRLCEAIEDITGIAITYIGDGRDPWDVFHEVKYLGNSRVDPCSDRLKRKVVREYITSRYAPGEAIIYTGIGAAEIDRHLAIKRRWGEAGYATAFPLLDYPQFTRQWQMQFCQNMVGFVPLLYRLGFDHNNCGGGCIKAGQAQWARLLWYSRQGVLKTHEGVPTFDWWRDNETAFREQHGDYTILRDWQDGGRAQFRGLTLAEFERRMDQRWGGYLPGFAGLMSGFDFEASIKDLEDAAGCSFCDAAA